MATLREYILGRKKKLPRGAAQSVAKYLTKQMGRPVRHERAVRLIFGVTMPDAAEALRIQDFISSRQPFCAQKTGPKPSFQKKLSSRSSDTNQPLTKIR